MTTLHLRLRDNDHRASFELASGLALLFGREPRVERLDEGLRAELTGHKVRCVQLPSQRVSANHLLVTCDEEHGVRAWDLFSRNGSWVRVLPGQPLALPARADLTFELTDASLASQRLAQLKDAQWTADSEYAESVQRAISDWLAQAELHVRVTLVDSPRPGPEEESLLLADGTKLVIAPSADSTVELPWRTIVEMIRSYVNEQNIRYEQLQGHDDDFILVAPIMRAAHRELVDAAAYGMRLMLLGPTGAGKDRLARCFHKHSRQHRGPYATVNCAMLHENLLYAQLFGAKKGSFTGSVNDIVGVIEAANDGTLFLDEVGDMDMDVQKALLRFLDSRGEYYRLGDSQPRRANVQVVCATNARLDDPAQRVGRFRDDLWYRLAVKVVRVPPLAERPEDIIAYLKAHTLRGGLIKAYDALSREALALVMRDSWPGNFRDLENFVERLPPHATLGSIREDACKAALHEGHGAPARAPKAVSAQPGDSATSFQDVFVCAFSAFEEDHGAAPKNWGQLLGFTEKYLKPMFVAQTCDLLSISELTKAMNYSEIARRLNVADGTTVKLHLSRYIERFRKRPGEAT
jgi:DNA-binding NtrC family response regulator